MLTPLIEKRPVFRRCSKRCTRFAPTVREARLLRAFFDRIVAKAYVEEWASSDHFTVDGTLIESYASMKSLRRKENEATRVSGGSDDNDPGNPTMNFRGEKRSNRTHRSLTDPQARLARKSKGI